MKNNNDSKRKSREAKDSYRLSIATEILATERMVLEFIQKDVEQFDEPVKPITQISLFDFRRRIQEKKDKIDRVHFED